MFEDDLLSDQVEGGPWVEEFEQIRTNSAEASPALIAGLELAASSPPPNGTFGFEVDAYPSLHHDGTLETLPPDNSAHARRMSWDGLAGASFKFQTGNPAVSPDGVTVPSAQSYFEATPAQSQSHPHLDHHRALSAPNLRLPSGMINPLDVRDDHVDYRAGIDRRASMASITTRYSGNHEQPWISALWEAQSRGSPEAAFADEYSPRSPGMFPLHHPNAIRHSDASPRHVVIRSDWQTSPGWPVQSNPRPEDSLIFAPPPNPLESHFSPASLPLGDPPLHLTYSPSEHPTRPSSPCSPPPEFSAADPPCEPSSPTSSSALSSPPAEQHSPFESGSISSSSTVDLHPAVQLAAANRRAIAAAAACATVKKPRKRPTPNLNNDAKTKLDKRHGVKTTVDIQCRCSQCGDAIGKLVLRGKREDLDVEFEAKFACAACLPLEPMGEDEEDHVEEKGTYADSLSAAVDRLEGIEVHAHDDRAPPPKVRATATVIGKKRRIQSDTLICDVCTRGLATGAVALVGRRDEPEFGVEAICCRCCDRYQRCSDCGGGGGPRLGVGKWRSQELFPLGRKTCTLSHLRLGSLGDMYYDIWPVCNLPSAELDDLVGVCRALYIHNMLAGLAVPEILEPVTALAKTYEEVQKLATDSWSAIEPLLREDVEKDQSIRRYVALRWTTPTPRKRYNLSGSGKVKEESSSDEDAEAPLVRKGKNLAGFVIAEMDLLTGSLFLAVTTPWATGETYDATTLLMQNLLRRIEGDISGLNKQRKSQKEKSYPDLDTAWLMMFFKKDSRLMNHLEHRRGFSFLEDFLELHPDADRDNFAPTRPAFLPTEFLKGWHVMVRKVARMDDWNARPSPEEKRRKKHPSKARTARAKVAARRR